MLRLAIALAVAIVLGGGVGVVWVSNWMFGRVHKYRDSED